MATIEIRLYRWRYFCPIRNRSVVTRGRLPADLIKGQYPDAKPLEGSEQIIYADTDPKIKVASTDQPFEFVSTEILQKKSRQLLAAFKAADQKLEMISSLEESDLPPPPTE